MPKPAQDAHTALLGPVLRASVGQVLTIVLKNNLPFAVNLEPAGVLPAGGATAAAADAADRVTGTANPELAPAVAPGETVTYRFLVPPEMGPSPAEPSAKMWLYRCAAWVDAWLHGWWGWSVARRRPADVLALCARRLAALQPCLLVAPPLLFPAPQLHRRLCRHCERRPGRPAAGQVRAGAGLLASRDATCLRPRHRCGPAPMLLPSMTPCCAALCSDTCSNTREVNTGDVSAGQERDIITVLQAS